MGIIVERSVNGYVAVGEHITLTVTRIDGPCVVMKLKDRRQQRELTLNAQQRVKFAEGMSVTLVRTSGAFAILELVAPPSIAIGDVRDMRDIQARRVRDE